MVYEELFNESITCPYTILAVAAFFSEVFEVEQAIRLSKMANNPNIFFMLE